MYYSGCEPETFSELIPFFFLTGDRMDIGVIKAYLQNHK